MLRKLIQLVRGGTAGSASSRPAQPGAPGAGAVGSRVELLVVDPDLGLAGARSFVGELTCPGLELVVLDASGHERFRWAREEGEEGEKGEGGLEAGNGAASANRSFFLICQGLPKGDPALIEGALLICLAENLDGVVLSERVEVLAGSPPQSFEDLLAERFLPYALWSRAGFEPRVEAGRPSVVALPEQLGHRAPLVKYLPFGGVTRPAPVANPASVSGGFGQYFSPAGSSDFSYGDATVGFPAGTRDQRRPHVLVTTPFLATGGAERTLYETLKVLTDRMDFTIVTLAPHQPELGDRRLDFQAITRRILSFGDWVHPDAMVSMLLALIDSHGVDTLYNANGTTLFYQFAPQLKAQRPELSILDHLYDHRVGYIESYRPELLDCIDLCIAENHRIRDTLLADYGWREEQVAVIWPCGRSLDAFPGAEDRATVRRRARRVLGAEDDATLVILTAARMHEQKRPLDLVALAARLEDAPVRFVIVGGGALEHQVDRAIEEQALTNIIRLEFRDDIPELIVGADVGCLVSEYEGLPVFMLECFQVGRPFLGTAVGEMGRVLETSGAGVVVETPGDLDALERAVRDLCLPQRRLELARRAELAAPEFSVERCAEKYAAAFLGKGQP